MNTYLQWPLLIILSAITALVMMWIQLPGALLLGPMAAGIVWSLYGGTLQVPRKLFLCAQAIIGCLVARSISPDMLSTFTRHWSLFLAIVCSTIAASSLMGWVISKLKVLPGTTAIWGSSPGAAAAMVLMAEEFGADARLVAFMQYLRVIIVAGGASLIARLWIDTNSATAAPIIWLPPLHWSTLETIALAASGIMLARLCRIPSGAMLVPMMLGMALQSKNLIQIDLPEWLLVNYIHLDPLTAYLATSPGGMDSIAVIAASSKSVDLEFVMALQTVRLFLVIFIGPALARMIARKAVAESSSAC